MSAQPQPLFDMSKATPIAAPSAQGSGQPLFDMSKATPVSGAMPADTSASTPPATPPFMAATPKASYLPTADDMKSVVENPVGASLTLPIVKMLIPVHEVLDKARSLTQAGRQDHPILAKIGDLADNIQELLTGGQSAGKSMGTSSGVLNNPVTQAMAAAPAVAEAAPEVANTITRVNPFRAKLLARSGTLATNALDEAADAAAADSRVSVGPRPSTNGMRPALDSHIDQIATRERALYDKVNEAAGVDMKDLYDKREMIQDTMDDPTTTNTDQLQSRLKDLDKQIGTGEKNARARGIDTEKMLQQAKADTQQRYAVQELKKKVFNNESIVSGNKAAGADETINIDSAIKAVENLDKPSRYAPQGSPTRLQQSLGEDGAKNFKLALYDAQRRGIANARLGQVAKWAAGVIGGGAAIEVAKHLAPAP